MKKVLILPYFGRFNEYFRLWLNSCRNNPDIDWMIITDIEISEQLPKNVYIIKKTFDDLKKEFEEKLRMKINLKKPYKLCDYKPFYGFLFSEYLQEYDFWGYCDCDLIFGNISHFLPNELFEKYDKLLRTGHLSFVRNLKEINELFFQYDTYRMTLTSPAIYGYDESVYGYHLGFAGELLENGYKFYQNDEVVADVDFRHYPFRVVTNKAVSCLFSYEDGAVYRIDQGEKSFHKTEMMYVHLQKRKMEVNSEVSLEKYMICPNEFKRYSEENLVDRQFWLKETTEDEQYYDVRKERLENRKRDVLRLLHEPKKLDSIMYRLRKEKG